MSSHLLLSYTYPAGLFPKSFQVVMEEEEKRGNVGMLDDSSSRRYEMDGVPLSISHAYLRLLHSL